MVLEWKMLVHWLKRAVKSWLEEKSRRKVRKKSKTTSLVTIASVEVQTQHVTIVDQEILRNEIQADGENEEDYEEADLQD